jgi:hypothetical protein
MAKRKIEAKKFRRDVRAGLSVKELSEKYELSERKVNKYIDRFISEGKLEPRPNDTAPEPKASPKEESAPYEPTIELATVCDKCGTLKLADSDKCPRCDLGRVGEGADDGTIEFDLDGDTQKMAKTWDKTPDIADQVSLSQEIETDLDDVEFGSSRRLKAIHAIPIVIALVLALVAGGVFMGILPMPPFMRDEPERIIKRPEEMSPKRVANREQPTVKPNQGDKGPASRPKVSGEQREAQAVNKTHGKAQSPPEAQTANAESPRDTGPQDNALESAAQSHGVKVAVAINSAFDIGMVQSSTIEGEARAPVEEEVNETHEESGQDLASLNTDSLESPDKLSSMQSNSFSDPDDLSESFLIAVTEGDLGRAKSLLSSGADANTKDERGNTALMLAAGMGDLKMARLLLENGADVHRRNTDGLTALGWAYAPSGSQYVPLRERRAVVRLLKEHIRRANGGLEVSPIIAPR